MLPTCFSLAEIPVLAGGAIPLVVPSTGASPMPFFTRFSAGLKRVGPTQFTRECARRQVSVVSAVDAAAATLAAVAVGAAEPVHAVVATSTAGDAPLFAGATPTAEWMTWIGLQAYTAVYEEAG